jgi:hypothetical protein
MGVPTFWNLAIPTSDTLGNIATFDIPAGTSQDAVELRDTASAPNSNEGINQSDPGTWSTSVPEPVPEPASAWLLAGGLAFLIWRERRAAMALIRRRQRLFEPVAS